MYAASVSIIVLSSAMKGKVISQEIVTGQLALQEHPANAGYTYAGGLHSLREATLRARESLIRDSLCRKLSLSSVIPNRDRAYVTRDCRCSRSIVRPGRRALQTSQ
jgi:homoserine kinase